ncbi:MAG: helix-turn-helix transcriptional regulator [Clostridia bacterium]|nr:helix-turn-helix transcriptional regulator [Clostridia bacterium]
MNTNSNCSKLSKKPKINISDNSKIATEQSKLFDKINKYVVENISKMDSISVNNIALHFGISIGYISKLYRQKTSMTFIGYVLELKLKEAKRLLEETPGIKVKDVAAHLGYTNTISFIRLFKKKTGLTPGEYRREKGIE